jgi:hypothetical protein
MPALASGRQRAARRVSARRSPAVAAAFTFTPLKCLLTVLVSIMLWAGLIKLAIVLIGSLA